MSIPLLVAGIGAKIGGDMIQARDARKNAEKVAAVRNSVLEQYLNKQRALSDESRGYFDTRMTDYAPGAQETALTGAQDARTGAIVKNITGPTDASEVAVSKSAPQVVRGTIAKQMLQSFNDATSRAKAMGKLGGYGDQWFNNNAGITDTARRIGTVSNFSKAEASMLPSALDIAENTVVKKNSLWGPILSTAGSFMTGAAGRGVGVPAGGTQYVDVYGNPTNPFPKPA